MKKLLIYVSAMLLPVGLLVSCNNGNNNEDDMPDNTFSFNGNTYSFTGGEMVYYGDYYSSSTENIDLELSAGGSVSMSFEMFAATGNTKLVSGTYTYASESYAASTFSSGEIYDSTGEYEVTGGTVVVAVSGTTYTITIDCILEGGGTLKGKYVGTLDWDDKSPTQLGTGTFSFNGNDYDFFNGIMVYRGDLYSSTADNIVLAIGENGPTYMEFSMFTATGNTKLVSGTYTYASASYTPFAISAGYVYDDIDEYSVTGGTVEVAVTGDNYTITVDCTLDGGGTLTGEYTGTLYWDDDSDNSGEAVGGMRLSEKISAKAFSGVSLKK